MLSGGGGKDRFVFDDGETGLGSDRDVILDFSRSQGDVIALSAVDADRRAGGDQEFAWRGSADLTGAAQLGYFRSGSSTIVRGSTDGDSAAELQIALEGSFAPEANWFVL
jgi:Ca2+-binding RTX toxin-like protein